jgi:protein ImuB
MKRVMCVWFPGWPLQRLRRARPELEGRPLVLYAPARGKILVTVCSPRAARMGVTAGMPLAEARAAAAGAPVLFHPFAPRADLSVLRKLAVWCQRFSPLVAVEEAEQPECLFVDVSGCGPVFGGEEALAARAVAELRRHNLHARAVIADTFGAAWAVAHFSLERECLSLVIAPQAQAEAIGPLPIEALRLPADVLRLLRTFDIRRVRQLLALPRAELPARFGLMVLQRLDQALGTISEVPALEHAPEPMEAFWMFEFLTADRHALEAVLGHLIDEVLARLRPRQWGVQRLLCTLTTATGDVVEIPVGLVQPRASADRLMALVRLHLERVELPAEVSALAVRAVVALPIDLQQEEIFTPDTAAERSRQLPALIERLSNRLGEQSVLRPHLVPDAQPELACGYEPWLAAASRKKKLSANLPRADARSKRPKKKQAGVLVTLQEAKGSRRTFLRPPSLKTRPVAVPATSVVPGGPPLRFEWHGRVHVVARCWGPERIETGWWRGRDIRRDYYLVETAGGERFWLFRTLPDEKWYLHGSFG